MSRHIPLAITLVKLEPIHIVASLISSFLWVPSTVSQHDLWDTLTHKNDSPAYDFTVGPWTFEYH